MESAAPILAGLSTVSDVIVGCRGRRSQSGDGYGSCSALHVVSCVLVASQGSESVKLRIQAQAGTF